jgi:hypothetical protein
MRFSKAQQLFRLTFVFLFFTAPATFTIIRELTDAANANVASSLPTDT